MPIRLLFIAKIAHQDGMDVNHGLDAHIISRMYEFNILYIFLQFPSYIQVISLSLKVSPGTGAIYK